jgi:hypothetical protein
MDPQKILPDRADKVDERPTEALDAPPPAKSDKVFRFVAPGAPPLERSGETPGLEKRDWSSALDLVNEACEAIRLAEERALTAERYTHQLNQYFSEQVKSLESRVVAAEKRAEAADGRAREAEEWLLRFHDAIVEGFKGVLGPE